MQSGNHLDKEQAGVVSYDVQDLGTPLRDEKKYRAPIRYSAFFS